MNAASPPPELPLASLLRKAAVDAGFDLEPERDGDWWRLRASGVPGVAWVRPVDAPSSTVLGALLALPLRGQLDALGIPREGSPESPMGTAALPPGAAGAVRCASPNALHDALRRVWVLRVDAPARLRDEWQERVTTALAAVSPPGPGPVIPRNAPLVTEAIAEVWRRVGQEVYREALLDFWEGRCAVTGLAVPELLRASHAKPWAVATDAERMDVHNGLLLAVHLDALFDRGFLTFDDTGRGILSPVLPAEAHAVLGLRPDLTLRSVHPGHLPYLAYHRAHVFRAG